MTADRRSFLKASSAAVVAFGSAGATPPAGGAFDPSFAHHVFFWLKDPQDRPTYADLVRSLREFRTIKGVKFVHVGAPTVSDHPMEAAATDVTYAVSYLVLFESKKAEATYLQHPLYARFVDRFREAFSKIVIYDSLRVDGQMVGKA